MRNKKADFNTLEGENYGNRVTRLRASRYPSHSFGVGPSL